MTSQKKLGKSPVPTPLFELRNLTKIYGSTLIGKKGAAALDDFSLTFYDGEPRITTIAGESGSGKSTLANLALEFIHPTTGNILYKGRDIATFTGKERSMFRR